MRRFAALALAAALGSGLAWGVAAAADSAGWFDGGRPGAQARQAIELLTAAATDGLDPRDYDSATLQQAVALAAQGRLLEPSATARLEQALSDAMQRYLADLHHGRIDPRQIHSAFRRPRAGDSFDAAAVLRSALAAQRLPDAVREAAPRVPMYERLRAELACYRALADHPAWRQPLPPLRDPNGRSTTKLEPGNAYAGLAVLEQRLTALGDLAAQPSASALYEGPLVDAVKAFQQRHGLTADGIVGKATLAQLQVSPAARASQIELMLERLRWTPLMQGPRMIVINVPEFVLRAYEVRDGRISVQREMKVVVGKAVDWRTPLFDEDLRFIEFSPYWNVPPSIARGEVVPRLRRDPAYLERQGFEFVGAAGPASSALSVARLDAVLAGQLRIRQRPGPQNALGGIKFVFPNRANIYLHDTPAKTLFERDRRDFSHGCIRVEQPLALATFVLQGMPEWNEERIVAAMTQGESSTLRLAEPVPVLIAYGTTLFKNGKIHFFDDLYGHDRRLARALRERPRWAAFKPANH